MNRWLFQLCSPGGARGVLQIFIFHRVLQRPDPLFPEEWDAARFDTLLGWMRAWFQILPLDEAVRRLQQGTLPARAAVLTFDDGYADNATVALPLLQRHGLPCSFFIATQFLNGGRMWNDTLIEAVRACMAPQLDLRGLQGQGGEALGQLGLGDAASRRAAADRLIAACKYLSPEPRQMLVEAIAQRAACALPQDLMMSTAQLRGLRDAGMQIGAHTVSHPILSRLDARQAADEMGRSKAVLEAMLDRPVRLFAYPNGKPGDDYLPDRDPGLVRELGFEAAVSTRWGVASRQDDPFQLPRFTPWDRSRWRFAARMLHHLVRR